MTSKPASISITSRRSDDQLTGLCTVCVWRDMSTTVDRCADHVRLTGHAVIHSRSIRTLYSLADDA